MALFMHSNRKTFRARSIVLGRIPEILSRVFFYLDAPTLIAVRSLSKVFEAVSRDEWRKRVHYFTSRYVTDVSGLYSVLGMFEGVVSGSVALAVLATGSLYDGFLQPTSDLDIYVPHDVARDELVRHYIFKDSV